MSSVQLVIAKRRAEVDFSMLHWTAEQFKNTLVIKCYSII